MKSVLISINPKWCELIASGKKTVEVRKTRPKLETPFKVYIYCTKQGKQFFHGRIGEKEVLFKNPDTGKIKFDYSFELMHCRNEYTKDNFLSGKVIGEFVCDKIEHFRYDALEMTYFARKHRDKNLLNEEFFEGTQVTYQEAFDYCEGMGYGAEDTDYFYGWHISNLVIYDNPKELSEFERACPDNVRSCSMCRHSGYSGMKCWPIIKPPQSWFYVEGSKQ